MIVIVIIVKVVVIIIIVMIISAAIVTLHRLPLDALFKYAAIHSIDLVIILYAICPEFYIIYRIAVIMAELSFFEISTCRRHSRVRKRYSLCFADAYICAGVFVLFSFYQISRIAVAARRLSLLCLYLILILRNDGTCCSVYFIVILFFIRIEIDFINVFSVLGLQR